MIITQFKGRLGNQLFEYAAARKFAIDGETTLKLDLGNYTRANKPEAHRIRFFNIVENIATEEECQKFKRKDFLYYLEKILPYYYRRFVWEKDWLYDKNLIGLKRKNMYIRGQFQSPEYFKGIEDILRKEFTLKEPQNELFDSIVSEMKNTNSVSLLIRRSDFVQELKNEYYECPPSYFLEALEIVSKKTGTPKIFIFSDGLEWVKNNIKFPFEPTYIDDDKFTDYQK